MSSNKDWAKANRDFMVKFVKVLAAADDNYRKNTAKWTQGLGRGQGGRQVVGREAGGRPGQHGAVHVPDACRAGDRKWLGGGKNSIAAKALAATAQFQLSQKQIEKTLPDYSVAVNPSYAADAAK